MPVRLLSGRVVEADDRNPDLSFLYHYIERDECDRIVLIESVSFHAGDLETESLEWIEARVAEDARRLEAYQRGEWKMIGMYAEAELEVSLAEIGPVTVVVRTPGLWSIESDRSPAYLRGVREEEVAILRGFLRELGVRAPRAPIDQWGARAKRRKDS